MSGTEDRILSHLVSTYPECAETTAQQLAELAVDNPSYAEPVCSVLADSLESPDLGTPGISNRLNAIVDLAVTYPDQATVAVAPLRDLVRREYTDPDVLRTLACLGALSPEANTHRLAETLAVGLESPTHEEFKTVAWGLAKLALADPDAITPFRRQLMELLAADPEMGVDLGEIEVQFDATSESNEKIEARQYAAEALAINATGHIETKTHEPPEKPLAAVPNWKTAAWGIQHCVVDESLTFDELDLHRESSTVESHGIPETLIGPLRDRADAADTRVAVAAVLALGYTVSNSTESREVREFLHQFHDHHGEIGQAARWVLTNPRLPLALHGRPASESEDGPSNITQTSEKL